MNPYEFLQKKGIKKLHQPRKRYSLSIEELIGFLTEYSKWKNVALMEAYEDVTTNDDQLPLIISKESAKGYVPVIK